MRNIRFFFLAIWLGCCCHIQTVHSWHNDELEVFDAVEEIKQNFYTLLEVDQTAPLSEIKKSFRKLSLTVHPDHNPSPTADQEFRQLVTVYDILRHAEKRKHYDRVLIDGLPDWKNALYYYRRVRKMGLKEMFIILAVIISIGQYLVAWASYLEQKFTLKELLKSKDRKQMKKLKKNKNGSLYSDEVIEAIVSKPSLLNTLPFQTFYLVKGSILLLAYFTVKSVKDLFKKKETPVAKEPPRVREPAPKAERPKRVNIVPELVRDPPKRKVESMREQTQVTESRPVMSGGLWTDDDILELIKLVKKHPAGEAQRWVKIADAMNRTVVEVTHMANKIKENDFRLPTEDEETAVVVDELPKKVKTKGGKLSAKLVENDETEKSANWTQVQQKALEMALNKYSKKSVDDRWEKIASCVPGKTKEDCILRYKKLTALIRERKEQEETNQQQDEETQRDELDARNDPKCEDSIDPCGSED